MAKIVTLDQTVPALTTDLGVSTPGENLALKNALAAAGITSGSGPVVGAVQNIPDSIVIPSTTFAEVVLSTLVMPAAGVIAITANAGAAPISSAPIAQPITGGFVVGIKRGTTLMVQGIFLGNQTPNGTNAGLPLGGSVTHSYVSVTAGDVITVVGTIVMVNPPGDYHTVTPAGQPQSSSVSYHYL